MARWMAWVGVAILLVTAGCAVDGAASSSSWMPKVSNFWGTASAGAAQIEVAILRTPLSDSFLQREAWLEVNEQALPMEQRPNLQANGLRVGLSNGPLPTELRDRLAAKDGTAAVRRITIKGGQEHFLTLTTANRAVAFDVQTEGDAIPVALDDALPGLSLHWTKDAAGQTVLRCEPRIRHGAPSRMPKPTSDLSSWMISGERPEEAYPRMAWEVPLGPNDNLVLGAWSDRPNSFGHVLFTDGAAKEPTQSLVVVRLVGSGTTSPTTGAETNAATGPAPLVVQSLAPLRN